MSEYPQDDDAFYPISSENKELGWSKVMSAMPTLLKTRRPASDEIRILHRLATHGARLEPYPDEINAEHLSQMMIQHGVPIEDIIRLIRYSAEQQIPISLLQSHASTGSLLNDGTTFNIHSPRRGHLRRHGSYKTPDCQKHVVHGSHVKPLMDYQHLGLSTHLDDVFKSLCALFDQLITNSRNPSEKKFAIALFQLWGGAVLHPFWDGNGRAFNAHFVTGLNRMGFAFKEIPHMKEVNPALENMFALIGPRFLSFFLEHNRIPVFNGNLGDVLYDKRTHDAYMLKLAESMADGMDQSMNPDSEYFKWMVMGMEAIELALGKYGYSDPSAYREVLKEYNQNVTNIDS